VAQRYPFYPIPHPNSSYPELPFPNIDKKQELEEKVHEKLSDPITEVETSEKNGEYRPILALVTLLAGGTRLKTEVDQAIDLCAHTQNLRLIIYQTRKKFEGKTHGDSLLYGHKLISFLDRYFTIIAFHGFLFESLEVNISLKKSKGNISSFTSWLHSRPEVFNLKESLSKS
jgi:hypothetical protein